VSQHPTAEPSAPPPPREGRSVPPAGTPALTDPESSSPWSGLTAALRQRPDRWRTAWWLWFIVLFGLSSIPGHHLGPRPFAWFDKLEHSGYFFLGGLLLGGWLTAAGRWPVRWWLLPLVAALVGLFDEIHQLITPGRSGLDPGDLIADVLGGTLAAAVVHLAHRRRRAQ
jgi:VanZ family protein